MTGNVQGIEAANCRWCEFRGSIHEEAVLAREAPSKGYLRRLSRDGTRYKIALSVVDCRHPGSQTREFNLSSAYAYCNNYRPSLKTRIMRIFGLRKPLPKPMPIEQESGAGGKPFQTSLEPNPVIDKLLESALKSVVTERELQEQRISFAYGNAPENSLITKDSVRAASKRIRLKG